MSVENRLLLSQNSKQRLSKCLCLHQTEIITSEVGIESSPISELLGRRWKLIDRIGPSGPATLLEYQACHVLLITNSILVGKLAFVSTCFNKVDQAILTQVNIRNLKDIPITSKCYL